MFKASTAKSPSKDGHAAAETATGSSSGNVTSATTVFYWGSTSSSTPTYGLWVKSFDNFYSGVLKTALHEIGHTMGLDDASNNAPAGYSVMNGVQGTNDGNNNVASDVSNCDDKAIRSNQKYFQNTVCSPYGNSPRCGFVPASQGCPCGAATETPPPGTQSPGPNFIWCCTIGSSPIVVDVDGNGFNLTDSQGGVFFDLNHDLVAERLSWTSSGSDDAWLVLDRDRNGVVDDGTELFGNLTPQPLSEEPNGFLALAVYDTEDLGGNEDGTIDTRDLVWRWLRLWQDLNHDGISQPSELHTCDSLGVSRFDLDFHESRRTDRYGNRFRYRAKIWDNTEIRVRAGGLGMCSCRSTNKALMRSPSNVGALHAR
jgi:hypothetical protein